MFVFKIFITLQMFGNVFLLQGLHLRVDYEDNVSTCPHPNTCQNVMELNSRGICETDVYNHTGAYDDHGETITVRRFLQKNQKFCVRPCHKIFSTTLL